MHARAVLVAAAACLSLSAAMPTADYPAYAATAQEELADRDLSALTDMIPVPKEKMRCPARCGLLVMDQTEDNYCQTQAYKDHLDACLSCAATDSATWDAFKDDVVPVAKECGDDATPRPSSSSSDAAPSPAANAAVNGGAAFAQVDANTTSSAGGSVPTSYSSTPSSAPPIATGAASSLQAAAAAWWAAPVLLAAAALL